MIGGQAACRNQTVEHLLKEAYLWLLVPTQIRRNQLSGRKSDYKGKTLILRASRKLVHEEHLITNYAALRLRFEALDLDLWRDVNHLDLKKLGEYLVYYLYLPRLKNEQVLLQAVWVWQVLWQENFAYATG